MKKDANKTTQFGDYFTCNLNHKLMILWEISDSWLNIDHENFGQMFPDDKLVNLW